MEKEKSGCPLLTELVIKKIRRQEPYSKLYNWSIDGIWDSTVKGNGWWTKRDLADRYLENIYYQITCRQEKYHRENPGKRYLWMILSNTQESDNEIRQIITNARHRTTDIFIREEMKKKRKSQKEIDRDFNNAYGHLSLKEQHAIKKGRRSGLNRYKPDICDKLDVNSPSLGGSIDFQLEEIELRDELRSELTEKEYDFMLELEKSSREEIARERQIDIASVERKERRLRDKIREILAS